MKICLVASAGGHLSQLLAIADSWDGHKTFCITTSDVVREKLSKYGKIYTVGDCNRRQPLRLLRVFLKCVVIVARERPNAVISTGAAPGCITCYLSKLTGAKIIWIDSITNVEKLSFSGRMVRHIADLFLVQWPDLVEKYKNVEFTGAVI